MKAKVVLEIEMEVTIDSASLSHSLGTLRDSAAEKAKNTIGRAIASIGGVSMGVREIDVESISL